VFWVLSLRVSPDVARLVVAPSFAFELYRVLAPYSRLSQFITFIDPAAAFTFFQVSSYQGLTLNNRRLKVGWGKNSGPLAPTLALAVHAGATRNVYIGNVEDFEVFSEERPAKAARPVATLT